MRPLHVYLTCCRINSSAIPARFQRISARFQSMVPPLASTQKDRIAVHLQQGLSPEIIADVEGVCARTVRRIRARLQTYGQHTSSNKMSALRPTSLIHPAARIDLRHFIEGQPWSYQNEMLYYLFDDWDLIVALSTLFNALKIMKINRKCLKREALKRLQKCRNLYFLDVSQFTHEMLVFLNESAVNEHTMHRKRDWAAVAFQGLNRCWFSTTLLCITLRWVTSTSSWALLTISRKSKIYVIRPMWSYYICHSTLLTSTQLKSSFQCSRSDSKDITSWRKTWVLKSICTWRWELVARVILQPITSDMRT